MIPGNANCIDTDNFDGTLDGKTGLFKADGIDYAWVGCQHYDLAKAQIANYHKDDIQVVSTYAYLYYGITSFLGTPWDGVGDETERAIQVALEEDIPIVTLDVEADPPYEAPDIFIEFRIQETQRAVDMVLKAGLEPAIYTYKPYWVSKMGNVTRFSHLKLLFAAYFWDLRTIPVVDFGGWNKVWLHQYMSTGTDCYVSGPQYGLKPMPSLHGVNVDYCQLLGEVEDMGQIDDLKKQIDEMKLAMFSGAEEFGIDIITRLKNADYRISQRVQGASDGSSANSLGETKAELDGTGFSKKGHTHQVQGDE